MISWLYISSINNMLFVLYEANNTYIKKNVGSLHYLFYSKCIDTIIIMFLLGYIFFYIPAILKEYNFRIFIFGFLHGIINTSECLTFCYIRETKIYNIEKLNYLTIGALEITSGLFNYNPNYLVSSYLITGGSIMIDTVNVNDWFLNYGYFEKRNVEKRNVELQNNVLNDLEAPLIQTIPEDNTKFNRVLSFDKIVLIHLFTTNVSDYIVKITVSSSNYFQEFIIFYFCSQLISIPMIYIYLTKYLNYNDTRELYYSKVKEIFLRYIFNSLIYLIYLFSYNYAIIIAPSITYAKALSKSWGLILIELNGCYRNASNFNDLNILGSLVIGYPTIIIYLTYYYQT